MAGAGVAKVKRPWRLAESRAVFSKVGEKMWVSDRVIDWFRVCQLSSFHKLNGRGLVWVASSIVYRPKKLFLSEKL
jgi:hypothetical protein